MLDGGNVEMILKIVGVKPEAITPLHEIAKGELKENPEGFVDRNAACYPIYLARILSVKLDQTYGTYTVELKIMVRCGAAMSGPGKEEKTRFGTYFVSGSVLERLLKILSIGQEQTFFRSNSVLVEKK